MKDIVNTSNYMKKALKNITRDDFDRVNFFLKDNENILRENIQEITAERIEAIISKLDSADLLTEEDIDYVQQWIVGDAQAYIAMENNFDEWIGEFSRLSKEISKYEGRSLDLREQIMLSGIIEDASRLTPNIVNYLDKKERISLFENATKDPLKINSKIVKDMLEHKLNSPDM